VTNGASRSSTSEVSRVAACASVRAMTSGRETGRVQRLDVLAGRDEDLPAQVAALLLGR
jgi:hypothetical protein